jgi:hypothetical protein
MSMTEGARRPRGLVAEGADGLLTVAMALIAASTLLVSCSDPGPDMTPRAQVPAETRTAPVQTAQAVRPLPPVPARKPKPPAPAVARPADPAPAGSGMAQSATVRPPQAPHFDPNRLVGLSEQETLRLLGQPNWKEETPPSRTWRYASRGCELRVFFFMEMTSRDFRSLSYELKSTDNEQHDDQQCFADLLAQGGNQ